MNLEFRIQNLECWMRTQNLEARAQCTCCIEPRIRKRKRNPKIQNTKSRILNLRTQNLEFVSKSRIQIVNFQHLVSKGRHASVQFRSFMHVTQQRSVGPNISFSEMQVKFFCQKPMENYVSLLGNSPLVFMTMSANRWASQACLGPGKPKPSARMCTVSLFCKKNMTDK